MALAYGYNNFYPYVVGDTSSVVPQYEPYILGQGNIKQYTCTPHRSSPGIGGTDLNAVYGQGLPVTRVEGQGNGGNAIEITAASEEAILNSFTGYIDDITYKGNKTPIGVRVVDPFALQDVDYELRMPSTNPANVFPAGATWELTISRDGVVETTIQSERTLDRPFDQIIPEYGIALKLGNPLPVNSNLNNNEDVYGYLTSSIEFADDDQQWLTFIAMDQMEVMKAHQIGCVPVSLSCLSQSMPLGEFMMISIIQQLLHIRMLLSHHQRLSSTMLMANSVIFLEGSGLHIA